MSIKEFIRLSIREKVEFYYSFFFEKFTLSSVESSLYKLRIIKILEDELNYFYLNRWYLKNNSNSKSISKLQSDLGHLTDRWGTDWAWIIHHIILDFLNIGIADYLFKKYGTNVLVYKWLPHKYFILAEEVYLKDTKTREPKLFQLDKLLKDGTAINLKASKTKPNIGVTLWNDFDNETYDEIWDMTELRKYDEYMIWDKTKKHFVYDEEMLKREEKRLGIKGTIKVTIGDKTFEV